MTETQVQEATQSRRLLARQRKLRSFGRLTKEFRTDTAGVIGGVVLLSFIVIAIATPLLFSSDELDRTLQIDQPKLASPSGEHLLGTDDKRRDMLAVLLWGSRTSLSVGLAAAVFAITIGALIGICSGYFGRWVDAVLSRIEEWFLVIPTLPLAIVLVTVLGGSLRTIIIVIGLTSWAGSARLIRAQTLTVKQRLYVERSRGLGAPHRHIIRRHIFPNVMPIILANLTLTVPVAILSEATLSFLGIGSFERESWGKTLEAAHAASAIRLGAWWYFLPVGILITTVVLSFTMVGNAVERVVNPKLRER